MKDIEEINYIWLGTCECCGVENISQDFLTIVSQFDDDGDKVDTQICPICLELMKNDIEEYLIVTREMAIEVGDITMEGMMITW